MTVDVGTAIKFASNIELKPIAECVAVLRRLGEARSWLSREEEAAVAKLSGAPLGYVTRVFESFNGWLAGIESWLQEQGLRAQGHAYVGPGTLHRIGGRRVFLVLAGDDATLGPWAIAHCVLAGARAVAKTSAHERIAVHAFVRALHAEGIRGIRLLDLDSQSPGAKEALTRLKSWAEVNVVYGEDTTIASFAALTPARPEQHLVPYWTGRSTALLLPDGDVSAFARDVIYGALLDRGNKCISTKHVLVPEQQLQPLVSALKAEYAASYDSLRLVCTVDEETLKHQARFCQAAPALQIGHLKLSTVHGRDPVLAEEPPFPWVAISTYGDLDGALADLDWVAASSPARKLLAVSVYTSTVAHFNSLIGRVPTRKLLHNRPTTYLTFREKHQGVHLYEELTVPCETIM